MSMTEHSNPANPAKHSPLPWVADPDWREGYSWNIHIVQGSNPDMRVCFMTSDGPAQENAALIVEAVNNHARLTAALTIAREALEFYADRSNYDYPEIGGWARAERALEEINQEAGS